MASPMNENISSDDGGLSKMAFLSNYELEEEETLFLEDYRKKQKRHSS